MQNETIRNFLSPAMRKMHDAVYGKKSIITIIIYLIIKIYQVSKSSMFYSTFIFWPSVCFFIYASVCLSVPFYFVALFVCVCLSACRSMGRWVEGSKGRWVEGSVVGMSFSCFCSIVWSVGRLSVYAGAQQIRVSVEPRGFDDVRRIRFLSVDNTGRTRSEGQPDPNQHGGGGRRRRGRRRRSVPRRRRGSRFGRQEKGHCVRRPRSSASRFHFRRKLRRSGIRAAESECHVKQTVSAALQRSDSSQSNSRKRID